MSTGKPDPAQDSEHDSQRNEVGNHRQQHRPHRPQGDGHHDADDDERRREALPEAVENLVLRLFEQRGDAGEVNRLAGGQSLELGVDLLERHARAAG